MTNCSSKRVLMLVAGGTGGHIYPAIAIADEIRERFSGSKILFTGSSSRMEMKKIHSIFSD